MLDRVVYLPLETVSANAALARPVTGDGGQVLAGEGQVLSRDLRHRLREQGVEKVPVHVLVPSESHDKRRSAIDVSYDHLFRHWTYAPGMRRLRRLLTEHRNGRET